MYLGHPLPEQQQQQQQFHLIFERFKTATSPEDKEAIFKDLRKTPHLFNAFLKMTKREGPEGQHILQQMRHPLESSTSSTSQQQFIQRQGQPQQQYFQGGGRGGGHQQQQQNGGTSISQFN